MKALELLKGDRAYCLCINNDKSIIKQYDEAIEELVRFQAEYESLNEYYWFARNHLESYRCNCGSLGRVGYLCNNKECTEV